VVQAAAAVHKPWIPGPENLHEAARYRQRQRQAGAIATMPGPEPRRWSSGTAHAWGIIDIDPADAAKPFLTGLSPRWSPDHATTPEPGESDNLFACAKTHGWHVLKHTADKIVKD
jgi:hypothetical protein